MGNGLVQISAPHETQASNSPPGVLVSDLKADSASARGSGRTFYIETFGCQMNVHDSEKVAGVLMARGYVPVASHDQADLVLYNTCSIRENAAQKVFSRLGAFEKGAT